MLSLYEEDIDECMRKITTIKNLLRLKNMGYAPVYDKVPLIDYTYDGWDVCEPIVFFSMILSAVIDKEDAQQLYEIVGDDLEHLDGSIIQKLDFDPTRNDMGDVYGIFAHIDNKDIDKLIKHGRQDILDKYMVKLTHEMIQYDGDIQYRIMDNGIYVLFNSDNLDIVTAITFFVDALEGFYDEAQKINGDVNNEVKN